MTPSQVRQRGGVGSFPGAPPRRFPPLPPSSSALTEAGASGDLVFFLNAAWRSHYAESFSGSDKQSVATWLGVSRRSVERWITLAQERRHPFPRALSQVEPKDWPTQYVRRLALTVMLFWGFRSPFKEVAELAQFEERFCSIDQMARWADAVRCGTYDEWLSGQWRTMHAAKDPDAGVWVLLVEYNNDPHNYKLRKATDAQPASLDEAYPAPPCPIIPDDFEFAGALLSGPVAGFDYENGRWRSGTITFVYPGGTGPQQPQPGGGINA